MLLVRLALFRDGILIYFDAKDRYLYETTHAMPPNLLVAHLAQNCAP